MAASITFDFLSRGLGELQGGVRKLGDNTVLAARGARVLSDAIEKLGAKENRTAAESKILAAALRQTGDAEDRVAARAVVADAAIRRLDDAMKDSAKDAGKARGEVSGLAKALDGLKKHSGPSLLGPALLLAPAIASLGGVAAGAAVGLGGAFTAGAGALAAFGAVAKPVLTSALTASQAVSKAQNTYNATIKAGVPTAQAQATLQKANASAQLTYNAALAGGANPAKALSAYHLALARNQAAYNSATSKGTFNAKAYAAEQKAIGKAYADLSPQQIALSRQLGAMSKAWQDVKAAQTPVVAGALQPWLRSVTDLTKNLAPIIAKVSPVIGKIGTQFDTLISSSAFTTFRDFIAGTGSAGVAAAGNLLTGFLDAVITLLPKFNPLIQGANRWLSGLGDSIARWANSQKTADQITAFMAWFHDNGPVVGGLLRNIGGALKALAPGLASGGALELKVISDFLGLVAKLPPAVAKPLAEVAGAALILAKIPGGTKVISFAVSLAGKGISALLGLIGIGGKTATLAVASGGMQTAADTMLLASRNMQVAAGGMAGEGAAGGAAAKGGLAGATGAAAAAAGPVAAGIFLGAFIRAMGDKLSPKGTFAGQLNNMFQSLSINSMHSFAFGGLEGWLTAKIGIPVGNVINKTGAFITGSFGKTSGQVSSIWSGMGHFLTGSWNTTSGQISGAVGGLGRSIAGVFGSTGSHADTLKNQHLTPLGLGVDTLAGKAQNMSRWFAATAGPLATAGSHADSLRNAHLAPLGAGVDTVAGKVANLGQHLLSLPRNVNTNVNVHGSGTGGINIVPTPSGLPSGNARFVTLAGGGLVRMGSGPTADDVPGWLSRGELVVPAGLVKAGAVDHLRGRLPGFASGGLIGTTTPGGIPGLGGWAAGIAQADAGAIEAAFAKALIAKDQAALNAKAKAAAAQAGSSVPGGGGGAGRWSSQILTALAMLGQSAGNLGAVEARMNQESGGNPSAINRSDSNWAAGTPSVGVMQVIGPTYQANSPPGWRNLAPMAYGVSEDVLANTYAGLRHAITAYPGRSLASVMFQAGGYAEGGLIPGYAAGGTVAQLRAKLAAEQAGERAKYFGLQHSFAIGPRKYRTKTVLSELATLAKRQKTELADYAKLGGAGLTSAHMKLLAAAAKAESGTAGDKALNRTPGGHPGFARGLRKYLGQLSATASGSVPAGSTAAAPALPAGITAAMARQQGPAFLKAWQTRHGGGFGAAWGPIPVNPQIDAMTAALKASSTLAGAQGLSSAQHKHYIALAADEKRRVTALTHERDVERSYRSLLAGASSSTKSWISAAGRDPSLAGNVAHWKSQAGWDDWQIGNISRMLGLSAAQIAAAQKAGTLGPGGAALPGITHTYGAVTDVIEAFLQSHAAPFARGGRVFDSGGWLRPGWNPPMYNATGRPEHLVPARGGGGSTIVLQVAPGGGSEFDRFMLAWMRKHVRVKGGGSAQRAFGTH